MCTVIIWVYCLHVALFCCSGSYIRYDLNMPKSMPKRRDGPQNFSSDSPLTVQGHFQARLLGELFFASFQQSAQILLLRFVTLLCFKNFLILTMDHHSVTLLLIMQPSRCEAALCIALCDCLPVHLSVLSRLQIWKFIKKFIFGRNYCRAVNNLQHNFRLKSRLLIVGLHWSSKREHLLYKHSINS